MNDDVEMSANEAETLVLKAARGGGLPAGLAEDLALAAGFTDLGSLSRCPCDSGAAQAIPSAIDMVLAGSGPQSVDADAALVAGYVAARALQTDIQVSCTVQDNAVIIQARGGPPHLPRLGRRTLSQSIAAHLHDMAAKTLVPETESSRIAGAGAGLTDND